MIELQQFDGLSIDEIIARLETLGYTRLADKPDASADSAEARAKRTTHMFRDPDTTHIVRIARMPELTRTFAAVCREHGDNPFFPHIFSDGKTADGAHITVMENLQTPAELGGVRPGIARAFATLPSRSRKDHFDVYKYLLADERAQPWLPQAVKAIAQALATAFHTGTAALDYNSRVSKTAADGTPPCVLFRTQAQHGKTTPMEGAQPVFAAPFREATRSSETTEKRLRRMCVNADVPFAP